MPKEQETFPTVEEFCVKLPLYAERNIEGVVAKNKLYNFISVSTNIDCFCVDCQEPSVFIGKKNELPMPDFEFQLDDRVFTREFFCSRKYRHTAYFHFRLKGGILCKIGQSPSMADIAESDLRQYRKVLSEDEYRELSKAVGLASHGVGIGSFVYLRRIFERLIAEAREPAAKVPGWDQGKFEQSRMEDKIRLLEHFLPPFLVEQRKLYSILSSGIHALTEKDCLEAFPAVRVGIELILDQKVAAKQQQEKMAAAKKSIGALQTKLGSGPQTA